MDSRDQPCCSTAAVPEPWIPEGCFEHMNFSHFSFRTLKDALAYAASIRELEKKDNIRGVSNALVFSREYQHRNPGGQRFFIVSEPPFFWSLYEKIPAKDRNFYEVIVSENPCRMYFDIEYEKRYNRGLNGDRVLRRLKSCLCSYLNQTFTALNGRMQVSKYILDLDSSTSEKFSHHLIVHLPKGHVFENNLFLGAVVKDFLKKVEASGTEATDSSVDSALDSTVNSALGAKSGDYARKLYKRLRVNTGNDENAKNWMIDLGVYNRNRNFRLYLSTKRGKKAPLLPANLSSNLQIYGVEETSGRKPSSRIFEDSLVTCVPLSAPVLTVDGGPNSSRFVLPPAVLSTQSSSSKKLGQTSGSEYPEVDKFILDYVQQHQPTATVPKVHTLQRSRLVLVYDVSGWRFCHNIGREHRSNHIYLVADLTNGVFYQKCFDPDCLGFRSEPFALPAELRLSQHS